ncbi:MAG: Hsp20/alpha crystallin family protein [Candidatus Cloacimonetes bacterium]|nr:Hsp20/alpha crystallin family protein [Candidatus Cloacimonadota bacterium]
MRDKIFSDIVGIQREMLKLIGEVSALTSNPLAIEDAIDDVWHPKCDVFQTDLEWIVVAELAGMEKEEINISISPEYLRISGIRSFASTNCPLSYYSMEIETGRFDRRIYFPQMILDKEKPTVSYINGILRIAFTLKPVIELIIPVQ